MHQFLGFSPEEIRPNEARVVILPVPFEASVSYGAGTADGPEAVIRASSQVELFDTFFEREFPPFGIYTLPPVSTTGVYSVMEEEVFVQTGKILDEGRFPLLIGGEHSITVPAVRAFARRYPDGVVLHFDAHADLRTSYQQKKWSHACTLHRIREMSMRTFSFGVRSMSAGEWERLKADNVPILFAERPGFMDDFKRVIQALEGPAWMTFDVDVFDPSVVPSTGTPEPGGLNWSQVMSVLTTLAKSNLKFAGADVTEFSPVDGMIHPDFTVAKFIHRLILALA